MEEDINNCIIQNHEIMVYVISLVISLFACILFALIQQLFSFGAKKRIQLDIEYIQGCAWQLEQALSFEDFRTAVKQADNIEKSIIHICDNMRYFTYGTCKKRKLFNTYIYNVFRFMDRVKLEAIGYDSEKEFKARCQKLYRYLDNPPCIVYRNWLQDSICMLSLLNQNCGIEESIRLYKNNGNHKDLSSIIDVNTFNSGKTINSFKNDVMTQEEYNECIWVYSK